MQVFHRTDAAEAIMRDGFRDNTGTFLLQDVEPQTGVFVSDMPLDCNEGTKGADLILVEVFEAEIAEHEWIDEEGLQPWREWCVPARMLNTFPRRWLTGEETEEAMSRRFPYSAPG